MEHKNIKATQKQLKNLKKQLVEKEEELQKVKTFLEQIEAEKQKYEEDKRNLKTQQEQHKTECDDVFPTKNDKIREKALTLLEQQRKTMEEWENLNKKREEVLSQITNANTIKRQITDQNRIILASMTNNNNQMNQINAFRNEIRRTIEGLNTQKNTKEKWARTGETIMKYSSLFCFAIGTTAFLAGALGIAVGAIATLTGIGISLGIGYLIKKRNESLAEALNQGIESNQAQQRNLDQEIENHQAQQRNLDQEIENYQEQQRNLDQEIENYQEQLRNLDLKIENNREQITILSQKMALNDEKQNTILDRERKLTRKQQLLASQINQQKQKLKEMKKGVSLSSDIITIEKEREKILTEEIKAIDYEKTKALQAISDSPHFLFHKAPSPLVAYGVRERRSGLQNSLNKTEEIAEGNPKKALKVLERYRQWIYANNKHRFRGFRTSLITKLEKRLKTQISHLPPRERSLSPASTG